MRKYEVQFSKRFKKSYKRAIKRGKDLSKLEKVVELLADGVPLPEQYRNHNLIGDFVKKIYQIILVIMLSIISFFYTNKVIEFIRNTDPIMKSIKKLMV